MSSRTKFKKLFHRVDPKNMDLHVVPKVLTEGFPYPGILNENPEMNWEEDAIDENLHPAATASTKAVPQQNGDSEDSNQDLGPGAGILGLDATFSTQAFGQKSIGAEKEEPRQESKLCRACSSIPYPAFDGYVLHNSAESLLSASKFCDLCRLVRYQLGRVMTRADLVHVSSTITLSAHKTPGKMWLHAYGLHLGELQCFAHPNSVAAARNLPQAYPEVGAEALSLLGRNAVDCFHESGNCFLPRPSIIDTPLVPPLLPRRVIDIEDTRGDAVSTIHLYEPAKDERAHYTTLSHRWGDKIIFTTTIKNIESRLTSIDYDGLPMSFKNAITVTRALGVRYLWIDAICIIQDDRSDWLDQAPLMGKIYKNAYCTIAAHSAQNSADGFLDSRSSQNPVPVASSLLTLKAGVGRLCIGMPRSFKEVIDCSYINQRGWVLQELTLSQRTAHFSNGCIYWDCPHTTRPRSIGCMAEPSAQASPAMKTLRSGADFVESWIDLITEYSKCQLTVATDKLVAISGIAAEWQSCLSSEAGRRYNSGAFECTLPQSLLWFSSGESLRRFQQRAPSWSWASVDGEIQFMNTRKATVVATARIANIDGSDFVTADSHGSGLNMRTSLRNASITTQSTNFGMDTMTGEFFLRARGVMAKGSQLETPGSFGGGQASLDHRSISARSVCCARLCTKEIRQQEDLIQLDFVLLIERVKSSLTHYRRIGVGIVVSRGFFDSSPPQDIIII